MTSDQGGSAQIKAQRPQACSEGDPADAYSIDFESLTFSPDNIICDGGSQIEGFGTSRSDLDLYLIYDADRGLTSGIPETAYDYHMAVGEVDQRTVDIELMSKQYLADLARTLNALDETRADRVAGVKLERLNTYYRMCIARPLYNETGFALAQAQFDKQKFARIFAVWCSAHAARTRLNGRQSLEAGDLDAAFEAYRDCYQFATDYHLIVHGEAFTSRKYRFSKLARAFGRESAVFQRCWDLKSLGDRTVAEYARLVERLCDDFELKDDFAKEQKTPTVKVKKLFRPFRVGSKHYVVENKTNMYPVPADALTLWSYFDGSRNVEELALGLAEREKIDKSTADARVRVAVEALQQIGACARSYAPRHS